MGCGTGVRIVLLAEEFLYAHITAIDPNEASLLSLN
ncbi:hypothetical protein [Peribacillus simplex]